MLTCWEDSRTTHEKTMAYEIASVTISFTPKPPRTMEMQVTTVGAIEGFTTSICLHCDLCGATLNRTAGGNTYHWSREDSLREKAWELGWTGPLTRQSDTDRCPECNAKAADRKRQDVE